MVELVWQVHPIRKHLTSNSQVVKSLLTTVDPCHTVPVRWPTAVVTVVIGSRSRMVRRNPHAAPIILDVLGQGGFRSRVLLGI